MGDDRDQRASRAIRIRPSFRLAVAVTRALRHGARQTDLGEESPTRVVLRDRAADILERARVLAAENREDPDAVNDLLALSSRDRRALQEAALGARQWGAHKDHGDANRAHRLLQAAITGKPLAPSTTRERERFAILDDFADLTTDDAWNQLTELEPRLADLEGEVRTGRFSRGHAATELHALGRDEARRAAVELRGARRDLNASIRVLVGPDSEQEDPLASSFIAFQVASDHLAALSDEQ
jgi:hypothetical protein